MSDILQTNIFFLITSVSVIVISGLVCIFIYQLIKVVNSVLRTAKKLEDGSDLVVKEMRSMRRNLRKNFNLSKLFMFVVNTLPNLRPKPEREEDMAEDMNNNEDEN